MNDRHFYTRVGLLAVLGFVVAFCWFYPSDAEAHPNLQTVPPPVSPLNDNFADAQPIASIPFYADVGNTTATMEPGEPIPSCASYYYSFDKTAWYALTPGTSKLLMASFSAPFPAALGVYSGNALTSLSQITCIQTWGGWSSTPFLAAAGTTYYFQLGSMYGDAGVLTLNLSLPPDPTASFYFYPYDPSTFDTIWFNDNSWDPAGQGIASFTWDFGDGTTAEGCCPNHRYAAQGAYTVRHTATTWDGRTGAISQAVTVKNHDVAITKFTVPQSGRVGQTRQIVVGINSKLNDETVTVQLLKSNPYGSQYVGELTQYVPVRPSNRTTDFNFSYTFAPEDAQVGKVTFRAIATLAGARDMLPADNEAISLSTKVSGGEAKGADAVQDNEANDDAGSMIYLPIIGR